MRAAMYLTLFASAVVAQAAPIALDVRAPAGCPSPGWVAARLDQLLQRPTVDPTRTRRALLTVTPDGPGLVAKVRLDGGERVLRTATGDCAALVDAATLALAVALDPIRGLALQAEPLPPPRPEPPVPVPRPPPDPEPDPVPSPEPAAQAPAATRWWLRAGGAASVGDTPGGLTGGPLLGVERQRGDWAVGLDVRYGLPTATAAPPGEVRADVWAGAVSGCWLGLRPLGLCVVGAAGAQRGAGVDLPDAQTVWAPLLSVGGRGRVDIPLSDRWTLVGTGDLRLPLSRTVLRVGPDAAWTSWPVWLVGSVGLAYGL